LKYLRAAECLLTFKSLAQAELLRRERNKQKSPDLLTGAFTKQLEFINDPAKLKATLCTRRAAKSYTGGLYLFKEALENAGTTCLYIALTRESAKKIMWKDVLKVLNRKHKLKARFNETNLTVTLPNGSIIYLVGVDSSEDEKEKLLGQKYKLVIIDEGASYNIDLHQLVYSTLKPAVADYRGTICIMGTPGNLTKSLYFDITEGVEAGWSVHKWNTFDNPYMAKQWQEEIDEITLERPLFIETPMFKQMYLGQWVIDESALVYKFNSDRNLYDKLPVYTHGSWQYLMGVDLGYEDDSAFVVVAYHEYNKILYVIDAYSKPKMDITDVATKIKEFKKKYDIHKVVIDGANKQAVEEIQKRHAIPLITADKTGKEDFIEIMNSELIQGKIKASKLTAANLVDEWRGLVWKEVKAGQKRIENPTLPNHLCDACLYIWRYCYAWLGEAPKAKPEYKTEAWYTQQTEDMEAAAEEYFQALEDANDPYKA
jgi:hypothetical protein